MEFIKAGAFLIAGILVSFGTIAAIKIYTLIYNAIKAHHKPRKIDIIFFIMCVLITGLNLTVLIESTLIHYIPSVVLIFQSGLIFLLFYIYEIQTQHLNRIKGL